MKIAIIGLGLIGGSAAIDLKARDFTSHIIGVDNNELHTKKAIRLGLVDEICSLNDAVKKSDLIIVATPADAAISIVLNVLDLVTTQTVLDFCSTKADICKAAENHPKRKNYVAAHPMAGTEFSGPEAAICNLFDNKAAIICDSENSSKKALNETEELFKTLNMKLSYMNSEIHDVHAAYVSHISHISSFVLALSVLEKEKNYSSILEMASGGFRSTVRLANSAASMWVPVFLQNKKNLLEVIESYSAQLEKFRNSIQNSNAKELTELIHEANKIHSILN